jgi:hypothetical protein
LNGPHLRDGADGLRNRGVIERFNREQLIRAVLHFVLGGIILWITWWAFYWAAWLVMREFWKTTPVSVANVASALTGLVFVSGVVQWVRGGKGYQVFKDTPFYASIDHVSGGAFMMQLYTHRITGLAYILSQLFLGGPWQICQGVARLRGRLPNDPKLELRMREVLGWMRASGQWETAMKYQDNSEELGALIRCGLVEFSATKGRVKAVPAKPGE